MAVMEGETKEFWRSWMQRLCDEYNALPGTLDSDGIDCPDCKNKGVIAVLRWNAFWGYWEEIHICCHCLEQRHHIRHNGGKEHGTVAKAINGYRGGDRDGR